MNRPMPTKWFAVLAVLAVVLVAAVGCGSSAASGGSKPAAFTDPTADSGVIRFAADFTEPPGTFSDNGNKQGFGYDLCNAAAEALGRKAEWTDIKFSSLIPGLQANKFDVVCSSMFITSERATAVNFVPYRLNSHSAAVKKGNPDSIKSIADICGRYVAVLLGSVYDTLASQQASVCTTAGKKAPDVHTFNTVADAVTQVVNGRADVALGDQPIVAYYVSKSPQSIQVAYVSTEETVVGAAIAKKNVGLAGALTEAMYKLNADGTYANLLKKWNMNSEAIAYF